MLKQITPLFILPVLFTGCMVRSLQPIYTEADVIAMPALEGSWKGEGEGEKLSFVKEKEGNGYLFSYVEGDATVTAQAHFATIGDKTYMDVTLAESTFDHETEEKKVEMEKQLGPFFYYAVPVHMFYQIEVANNTLRMRPMNYSWAKDRHEKRRLWIAHYTEGDSTLLTGDTARVQRFLRRWANSDEAWASWEELPLIPAASGPK